MAYFLYAYRGLVLIISLCVPAKRQLVIERWKRMNHHQLIREIGSGLVGLLVCGSLLYYAGFVFLHRK
jgi:hypothetical protein